MFRGLVCQSIPPFRSLDCHASFKALAWHVLTLQGWPHFSRNPTLPCVESGCGKRSSAPVEIWVLSVISGRVWLARPTE